MSIYEDFKRMWGGSINKNETQNLTKEDLQSIKPSMLNDDTVTVTELQMMNDMCSHAHDEHTNNTDKTYTEEEVQEIINNIRIAMGYNPNQESDVLKEK